MSSDKPNKPEFSVSTRKSPRKMKANSDISFTTENDNDNDYDTSIKDATKNEFNIRSGDNNKQDSKSKKHLNKTKRRSRHEEDGRIFKCECGKSYLSDTALTNHRIVKHKYQSEKRGKGRPKKFDSAIPFSSITFNKYNEVYFTNPLRVKRQLKFSISQVISIFNASKAFSIEKEEKSKNESNNEYHEVKHHSLVESNAESIIIKESIVKEKIEENIVKPATPENNSKKKKDKFKEFKINKKTTAVINDANLQSLKSEDNPHVKVFSNINDDRPDKETLLKTWLGSLFDVIFTRLSTTILKDKNFSNYALFNLLYPYLSIESEDNQFIVIRFNNGKNQSISNPNDKATIETNTINSVTTAIQMNDSLNQIEGNITFKTFTIDECMIQYLIFISSYTNIEYFHFALLFLILMREFLNNFSPLYNQKIYHSSLNSCEYTTDKNVTAQELPTYCEAFIADFLEPNDYYSIHDPDEILQIIQHFCYWLYDRGYTSLRMSLVNLVMN